MQIKFGFLLRGGRLAAALMAVFAIFVLTIGCGGGGNDPVPLPDNKTVATAFGDVQGTTANEVWVWKGIPYARAPIGELRWKAPVDPDAWEGVRDATQSCSECVQQVSNAMWLPIPPDTFVGSEDCLYLDIYAPRTSATNLPVFFFIHGGSNNSGSAKAYEGSYLAQRGNMIVVFVQYRLNAMGFLTHPALRASGTALDQSGNYGMLDIMKALEWVQANIAAFGGDPAKVVIGGQSAGGHDVMNLITSPQPANYRGAFMASVAGPGVMTLKTVAESDTWTNTTIDGLLIRDGSAADAGAAATIRAGMSLDEIEAYLRGKDAITIARSRRDGTGDAGSGSMAMHSAIRDGVVVRDATWVDAIDAGNYHKVPMIIGTTHYEWRDFAPLYGNAVKAYTGGVIPSGTAPTNNWLYLFGVIGLAPFPSLTLDQVLVTQADRDFYLTLTDLRSQHWRLYGQDNIIRALKANDPTNVIYSYRFDWVGGGDPALDHFATYLGAGHAMDMPLWAGFPADAWNYSFTAANRTGREALSGAMLNYLASFVGTLNPNPTGSSLPTWAQWDTTPGNNKMITFNASLSNYLIAMDNSEIDAAVLSAAIAAQKVDVPTGTAYVVNGM